MGRTIRVLAALAVTVVVAAGGCTTGQELPRHTSPDDVVRQAGTLGSPVDYFGVEGTMLALEPYDQSTDGFPRLQATMRTQSHLEVPWEDPNVELRCDESSERAEWYRRSTWEANGILPGGRIHEGQIIVGFPPKDFAARYPVPTCTNAAVEVTGTDPLDRDRKIITRYAVRPEMIAAAIDAPRG